MSKCFFCKPSVQFLGHVVSGDGVHVGPSKIEVIVQWPKPRDVSELRSFLGLGKYFKGFIQGYAVLTGPLVELTKPSKDFGFGESAQAAFDDLKWCLSNAPVLALPDVTKG